MYEKCPSADCRGIKGGFAPHIDAVAYTHIKDVKHLTILLAVDESNMGNGGLEVVDASHGMTIPINDDDHCIQESWVDSQEWTPVELEAGMSPYWGFSSARTD